MTDKLTRADQRAALDPKYGRRPAVDRYPVQMSVAVAEELGEVKVEFEIVICWVVPAVPHATNCVTAVTE